MQIIPLNIVPWPRRYRSERLAELEARFRRSGTKPFSNGQPISAPNEAQHHNSGGGSGGDQAVGHDEEQSTGFYKDKTFRRSKQRREIKAVIAAAVGLHSSVDKSEQPCLKQKEEDSHKPRIEQDETSPFDGPPRLGPRVDSRIEDSLRGCNNSKEGKSPAQLSGRPPLAPSVSSKSRKWRRWRHSSTDNSGADSRSESGRISEDYAWDDDSDADEVQTEAARNNGEDAGALWGDEEDDDDGIWEDSIGSMGWEAEGEAEQSFVDGAINCSDGFSRQRHWVGSGCDSKGRETESYHQGRVQQLTGIGIGTPYGQSLYLNGVRTSQRQSSTTSNFTPSAAVGEVPSKEVTPLAAAAGVFSGRRSRNPVCERQPELLGRGQGDNDEVNNFSSNCTLERAAGSNSFTADRPTRRGGQDRNQSGIQVSTIDKTKTRAEEENAHVDSFEWPVPLSDGEEGVPFETGCFREESKLEAEHVRLEGKRGRILTRRSPDRKYDGSKEIGLRGYGGQAPADGGASRDKDFNSAWSLSAEEETRGQDGTQQVHTPGGFVSSYGEEAIPDNRKLELKLENIVSEASKRPSGAEMVTMPVNEYQDDFCDNSARQASGADAPFAVSPTRCSNCPPAILQSGLNWCRYR